MCDFYRPPCTENMVKYWGLWCVRYKFWWVNPCISNHLKYWGDWGVNIRIDFTEISHEMGSRWNWLKSVLNIKLPWTFAVMKNYLHCFIHINYLISFPLLRCHFEHSSVHSVTVTCCMFTCSVRWCTAEYTSLSLGLLHWRILLLPSACWGHKLV